MYNGMLSILQKGSQFVSITVEGDEDVLYTIKSDYTQDIEALSGSTTIIPNLDPQKEYIFTSSRIEEVAEETLVGRLVITNSKTFLSLAEVQLTNSSGNTNFATRGTANQSSTGFGGVASRAIDGNVNQKYGGGSVTHTARAGWWQLKFSSPVAGKRIAILNRDDGFSIRDRLRGSILKIFDQNNEIIFTKTLTNASKQTYTFL